ncbi:hypothetical protein FSP39_013503 [Pinctada imbricata]|uniref:exodeoxyribonuclease III n=1 Tax=Pinctada imbricata TaxID=66713 RepID=A0AA89BR72_PINIB|nr:hypothetical protein FSP39_013503 [Pinctada imbricata]
MENSDILCIQEHWLYTYKHHLITEFSPDHRGFAKSVDMNDQLLPQERSRGHGGIAILWNKKIDKYITVQQDGGHRVQVIEINRKNNKWCIINTYMPCRGTHTKDDYEEILDEINEIIVRFGNTHNIIICGDMNASLHREPPNKQDLQLRKFMKEKNLLVKENPKGENTFSHHNGINMAKLDYILYSEDVHNVISADQIEESCNDVNVSDHAPLS